MINGAVAEMHKRELGIGILSHIFFWHLALLIISDDFVHRIDMMFRDHDDHDL